MAIRASEIGLPLVRPLPTIFAYAQGVQSLQIVPNVTEEEFYAHVDCLIDLLETACLRARIPASVCKGIAQKAVNLTRSGNDKLIERVNDLLTDLTNLSRIHKSALKSELNARPEIYRDIYWGRVYTKKITLVHQKTPEAVERIANRLRKSCAYDVAVEAEKDLTIKPTSSDMVLFHPTEGPIRPASLATAAAFGLPTLILIDLGRKTETADPVAVKIAHLYARSGLKVLYRPFTPLRLFSAIDSSYVEHLLRKPVFAGARAKGEVA
ncbi:MAG: hypothetical protein KAW17_11055 [Candidatus Eisenbacteria sp.]|nr:hypothetical protein [Candidatus Eisenbacteria bacterium]